MVTNTTIVNEYKLKSKRTRKCIGYQTYNYKMYRLSSVQLQFQSQQRPTPPKQKREKLLKHEYHSYCISTKMQSCLNYRVRTFVKHHDGNKLIDVINAAMGKQHRKCKINKGKKDSIPYLLELVADVKMIDFFLLEDPQTSATMLTMAATSGVFLTNSLDY